MPMYVPTSDQENEMRPPTHRSFLLLFLFLVFFATLGRGRCVTFFHGLIEVINPLDLKRGVLTRTVRSVSLSAGRGLNPVATGPTLPTHVDDFSGMPDLESSYR